MHTITSMGGWLVWVLAAFMLLMIVGAGAIVVDAARRRAVDFGRMGRAPWIVGQAGFLVVLLLTRLFGSGQLTVRVALFAIVFAFAQQVTYLLRVVFPSPERLAARELAAVTISDVPPAE